MSRGWLPLSGTPSAARREASLIGWRASGWVGASSQVHHFQTPSCFSRRGPGHSWPGGAAARCQPPGHQGKPISLSAGRSPAAERRHIADRKSSRGGKVQLWRKNLIWLAAGRIILVRQSAVAAVPCGQGNQSAQNRMVELGSHPMLGHAVSSGCGKTAPEGEEEHGRSAIPPPASGGRRMGTLRHGAMHGRSLRRLGVGGAVR